MEEGLSNAGFLQLDYIEEGRRDIFEWREKRRTKRSGLQGRIYEITKLFIDRTIIRSFINNLSIVVGFQMLLAAFCTYACVKLELDFDVHMSLFVSPIVFPLAFSINANYQRRETVLEDLAMFKAASLILFFCHRDWITAVGLPGGLLKALSNTLGSLVINTKEYLLTEDCEKRKVILQAVYEDFSDISQLNDKLRTSEWKSNSPLISRVIHCHNLMCWSFEKLRVMREYKSPRSLRAFTKVFIYCMPLLLSPYYVYSGRKINNAWAPYYISVLVSFLFGSLQAVQDKLDDPFDGIGEDDVNLGQLDEWTTQSLLTNRTVTVGRFTVTTTSTKEENGGTKSPIQIRRKQQEEALNSRGSPTKPRLTLSRKHDRYFERGRPSCVGMDDKEFSDTLEARCHGISSKLEGLTGSSTILPGNRVPYSFEEVNNLWSPRMAFEAPSGKMPNDKNGGISDEEEIIDSNKENSIRFFFPGENRLDVIKETDEEYVNSSRQMLLPPVQKDLLNMTSDRSIPRPEGNQNEKRPTIKSFMELFSNEPVSIKDNDDAGPKTNEVSTTSDEAEQLPVVQVSTREIKSDSPSLTGYQSETSLLSPQSPSEVDSLPRKDTFDSPVSSRRRRSHPHQSVSEKEAERNSLPKLKFSLSGKRKAWSMPDSLNRWRKRRPKRNSSSSKTTNQFPSESGFKPETTTSPLLSDETDSGDKNRESSAKLAIDMHEPLKFDSTELMSPDLKQSKLKPCNSADRTSFGEKDSCFDVSGSSSKSLLNQKDQDSQKGTNSVKNRGSRFTVSTS